MAFPVRKILCPIDFDDNSLGALDKAIEIAHHFQAHGAGVYRHCLFFYEYQEQQKAARARLEEITAQKLAGLTYESATYIGDVVGSILQAVDKFEPRPVSDGHALPSRSRALLSGQRSRGGGPESNLPGVDDSWGAEAEASLMVTGCGAYPAPLV